MGWCPKNPGTRWPDLPGELRLQAVTRGRMGDDGSLPATLQLGPVSGTLRGYPLSLEASTESDAEGYHLRGFRLTSDENLVEATARLVGNQLSADWVMEIDRGR